MYVKFSYINSTIREDDDEDDNCGGELKEKDEGIESIESILYLLFIFIFLER